MEFPIEKIEAMIYTIRGQRIMLDSDLAQLYGVETKRLIEQVKRNVRRFPQDFLIEPNFEELEDLRSQFATANRVIHWNYKRRSVPLLFTENGVAMLSSVLNSDHAIDVNIAIMRTFTKLRSFLVMEDSLDGRVNRLEEDTQKLFKIVFKKLDNIEETLGTYVEAVTPKLPNNRKKIGLRR